MSPNNVTGGHKAAINNPNVSEEKKDELRERLDNMEDSGEVTQQRGNSENNGEKNEGNVIGGYKATLKNPNVSDEAKEHAKEVLGEHGVEV